MKHLNLGLLLVVSLAISGCSKSEPPPAAQVQPPAAPAVAAPKVSPAPASAPAPVQAPAPAVAQPIPASPSAAVVQPPPAPIVSVSKAPASAEAAPPTPTPAAGPRLIAIGTVGVELKFNTTNLTAAPGEELKVVFTNNGTLPKVAMGHNWVLLKSDTNIVQFTAAGVAAGLGADYISPTMAAQVIAHTKILGPGENETIVFKAPAIPGEYPFICTFPAHAGTMKGILTVR